MEIKLTKSHFRAMSYVSANYSAVFLASLVVPFIGKGFDLKDWFVLVFGVAGTITFTIFSALFGGKGKL